MINPDLCWDFFVVSYKMVLNYIVLGHKRDTCASGGKN